MKIYEGGNLVRDYYPCYKGNNVGLCDMVTKKVYRNIGTGSFNVGPDIQE